MLNVSKELWGVSFFFSVSLLIKLQLAILCYYTQTHTHTGTPLCTKGQWGHAFDAPLLAVLNTAPCYGAKFLKFSCAFFIVYIFYISR